MSYSQTVNANRSTKAHTRVANPSAQRAKEKASLRARAVEGNIYVMFDLGFYFLDLFITGHFQEDLQ